MTETEFKRLCLLRAFEHPITAPWSEPDAIWASDEARRQLGGDAPLDAWAIRRAELGLRRLGERSNELCHALQDVQRPFVRPAWGALAAVLAGLLCGALLSSLGRLERIDLLSPPLLGLLLWNVLAFCGLLTWKVRRTLRSSVPSFDPSDAPSGLARVVHRASTVFSHRSGQHNPPPAAAGGLANTVSTATPALARFETLWLRFSAPLWRLRWTAWLHLAAASIALGALISLYLRGLAYEFRVSWDSTFLTADQALVAVGWVLGPASALSGIGLPTSTEFEALRGVTGGGENAARWIHLWALTLGGFVVLPRMVLAAWSGWHAKRLSGQMPLTWRADPVFSRLALHHGLGGISLHVLPYRIRPSEANRLALRERLTAALGQAPSMNWADPAGEGDEEAAAERAAAQAAPDSWLLPMVAAAHTPERETHGRFMEAVSKARTATAPRIVLVDETGFGARLTSADRLIRRDQRRTAWRSLAAETGHQTVFLDLEPAALQPLTEPERDALARVFRFDSGRI